MLGNSLSTFLPGEALLGAARSLLPHHSHRKNLRLISSGIDLSPDSKNSPKRWHPGKRASRNASPGFFKRARRGYPNVIGIRSCRFPIHRFPVSGSCTSNQPPNLTLDQFFLRLSALSLPGTVSPGIPSDAATVSIRCRRNRRTPVTRRIPGRSPHGLWEGNVGRVFLHPTCSSKTTSCAIQIPMDHEPMSSQEALMALGDLAKIRCASESLQILMPKDRSFERPAADP